MRRAIISIIIVLSLLSVVSPPFNAPLWNSSPVNYDPIVMNDMLMADIMHSGNSVPVFQYLNRSFSNQLTKISNNYAFPDTHAGTIDLTSYQIPGWTLYKVVLDNHNMTAIAEREVAGKSASPSYGISFQIYEHDLPALNLYYDQLTQGFYNQVHDGQLQNVSLYYDSPSYDPVNNNYAYVDIRSNYQDGSTNMVSSVQLSNVGLTRTWASVTENTILDAGTTYYTVINGTVLIEYSSTYPTIRWFYEDIAGSFLTRRHNTDGDTWGSDRPYETLLNYTYIPWNKTSNSALVYTNPASISMMLNGTPVVGSRWVMTSANNITSFPVTTNQSVNVFYDLTLCYRHEGLGSTNWGATTSGGPIMWNVTADLSYPAVSNIISRTMDITNLPLDWAATGLYLGLVPSGAYSKSGTIATCTGLSDGTWTLTSTAPNYAVDLALSDNSDSTPIIGKVANLVLMDIDAAIEDGIGTPMTGGSTNLSILQSSNIIYSPSEIPASSGSATFQWNISATTSSNNTHSVEVYWISADGLEAGYITEEIFVYHSTTLAADETVIDAYTENTFNIGIDFNEIYPAIGLDPPTANVTYSFGSVENGSMTNSGGGRWTRIVNTTSMSSGPHNLTVYAEGFALENQSLVILVYLEIETLPLNWSWSPSNNIQYLESTNLTVSYWDLGDTGIEGATVNITFDSATYNLTWDASSRNYWIQLNGSDFLETNGTTIMVLQAWKMGYVAQFNDTISITIHEESTGIGLVVNWNPIDRNISYIESITITVSYTYNSNPITDDTDLWPGASVNVTFSGHSLVNMIYNATSQLWEVTLDGSDYFGVTSVTIRASATGYTLIASPTVDMIVIEDVPILTSSWLGSAISTDYDHDVDLTITVTDSLGSFINDAILSANVFGTDYPMVFVADGVYELTIPINESRGVHIVNVTMVRIGYTTSTMLLDLTVRATTSIDVDILSTEYEQWNLTVTVTYTDAFYSTPISGGTVTVTIDGVEYTLTYDNGEYIAIILLDFEPGTYTISVEANAQYCNTAIASPILSILEKSAVYLTLTTQGDPSVEGQRLEIIATLLYNGTEGLPVQNQHILFIVTIYYINGTVEVRDNPSQYDTTNTGGVASWGFEIPSGNIERIVIQANYAGSRVNWNASIVSEVRVGSNPLILLLSFFFMNDVGRMILVTFLVLGIVAMGYNKRIKPKKRAARTSLENQLQMFRDLETLRHFMAVYLDRGTCVFYHPFTDERIQPDLISGFIAAITSVYGEIKGDGVRGTLEEIQYHGLRLNSYSGEFIIGILILEGEMTPLLKDRLQFFVELFENQYDQDLTQWNGLIDCFDSEWIVSTLTSAFNYSWLLPHKIVPIQKVGKTDARILDYIAAVRNDRNEFQFRDVLEPLAEMLDVTEADILDRLLALQDKGNIVPASIQTILQRQGMGLANGEIGDDSITYSLPEKDEEPPKETEIISEIVEEPEKELDSEEVEEKVDPMDEFVKDVESLLKKKKQEEENGDS